MEERLKAVEDVVEQLYKKIEDMNEVLKMHIRFHIGDFQPVNQISMKGTTEDGISYTWGSSYRAEVNKPSSPPNEGV